MPRFKNAMEIFKLLNHSNCRDCLESSCLAFAAAVFQDRKALSECPHLPQEVLERFSADTPQPAQRDEDDWDAAFSQLKKRIREVDLRAAAPRLGAAFSGEKLTMKVMGKNFSVDIRGDLHSDIHVHQWIALPVLSYILEGAGKEPAGKWIPFRELDGGRTWYRLFEQRCEKPLKQVADTYTDLFEEMIRLFNGKTVEHHDAADISLVLHPLPKVPMLICYWKPEDGMASSLNLFFDDTAEENLPIESIYALGTGLVRMFEKIALRHGIS